MKNINIKNKFKITAIELIQFSFQFDTIAQVFLMWLFVNLQLFFHFCTIGKKTEKVVCILRNTQMNSIEGWRFLVCLIFHG